MLLRGRAQRTLLLHNDHAQLPAFADAATGRERSPKSVLLRGVQRTLFRHDHAQPQTTPTPSTAVTTSQATVRAITQDQAKSQIEAKGYSNVSGLRKDAKGIRRGKAMKDGSPVNLRLDLDGSVTTN
jgi:hypothetical protein